MPRFVRNFWATVNSNARQTPLETGPVTKDGGISIILQYRNNGSIADDELEIEGEEVDGTLYIRVCHKGKVVYEFSSPR